MKETLLKALVFSIASVSAWGTVPQPLQAKDGAPTLEQLLSAARENNLDLRAAREEIGTGDAARMRAGVYANPVLEAEGDTAAISGNGSENSLSLGISQEFSTGGKRQKRIAAADAEIDRILRRIDDTERQLLLDVKTGYFDLLLAQRRIDLAGQLLELNRQLLDMTKERFAAGDIAEIDVNLARVEAARSTARKREAERVAAPARLKLLSLTGTTIGNQLMAVTEVPVKPVEMTLPELKELALSQRPDLLALEAEKRRAEADAALARAERMPNVTAGVALSRESSVTTLRGVSEKETDYLIGLKLSIPIPVFDRNRAGVLEAQAKKRSAEARLAALRQTVEREVETAYGRLTAAEEAGKVYSEEIIPQLSENLKIVQEAYKLGETGILAVLEEQKKFLEVNDTYLGVQYERNIAAAQLEAAVGSIITERVGGTK